MTGVDSRSRSHLFSRAVARFSESSVLRLRLVIEILEPQTLLAAEAVHLNKPGEGNYQDQRWNCNLDISLLEECTVHDRHARVRYRIDRAPEKGRSGCDFAQSLAYRSKQTVLLR